MREVRDLKKPNKTTPKPNNKKKPHTHKKYKEKEKKKRQVMGLWDLVDITEVKVSKAGL